MSQMLSDPMMDDRQKIIMVEDDAVISELIDFNLTEDGYGVKAFRTGTLLFQELCNLDVPSLFILDLMLPGMDGFEICTRLRADNRFALTPIMLLTARGSEADKVRGLESGADDYMTKPFGIRELIARVHAQTRRDRRIRQAGGLKGSDSQRAIQVSTVNDDGKIASCGIELDDVRHRVFRNGIEVGMTNREYELIKYLMLHRGVAFSRDDLLNRVWGYDYGGETRTVDVHIRQLRRKLEADDSHPVLIQTVRGRGYRFADEDISAD